MANLFFPGGTRFSRRERRNRCLWREESLLMHLLRTSVNAALGLRTCLEDWSRISLDLREPPRQRGCQLENLESRETLLS
jgi:hypothetical protein